MVNPAYQLTRPEHDPIIAARVADVRASWQESDRITPRWTPKREPRTRGLTRTDWLMTGVLVLLLVVVAHSPLVGG